MANVGGTLPGSLRIVLNDLEAQLAVEPIFRPEAHVLVYETLRRQGFLGIRVLRQLGILSAKYVLPIWDETSPDKQMRSEVQETIDQLGYFPLPLWKEVAHDYSLPLHLIKLAEAAGDQTLPSQDLENEAQSAHSILGNFLGFLEPAEFPQNAWYAGQSALRSLETAVITDPFKRLYYKRSTLNTLEDKKSGENPWTLNVDDAASDAAIAFAGVFAHNKWTHQFDVTKTRIFWRWWLTQAIPEAWELAQKTFENH